MYSTKSGCISVVYEIIMYSKISRNIMGIHFILIWTH